jgi:hypothetical protein
MKQKRWLFLLIGLIILTSLSIFGQTKKLRDVGRYRFIPVKAGASASEIMNIMLEKYAGDIERGFALAGSPNLYLPFMEQVKQSAFSERELAVGETMLWMVFRSQGQIKVTHDLEWAGAAALPVYSFSVVSEGKKHEIVMPKICGNIALLGTGSVAAPAAGEEQKPPQAGTPPFQEKPEERYQISKAKIYQEFADLINEVDMYCSYSVWDNEIPGLEITGAERESEKTMYSDKDIVYLNQGADDGIEAGQIFRVLEIKDQLQGYGPIALGKGRARVQYTFANTSIAVVENSCSDVRRGHYLIPFEAREGVSGKDLGYDVFPDEGDGLKGSLVYLQANLKQIGSNHWAIIDLGAAQGIQVGQQLVLYRKVRAGVPVQILGNSVAIDVQSRTSTIKILSCRDVIHKGDLVMERPAQ